MFSRAWQRYNTLLKERPIPTKVASTFVINFTGDIICQLMMHSTKPATSGDIEAKKPEKFEWDKRRTIRQSLIISIGYTTPIHLYLKHVAHKIRCP